MNICDMYNKMYRVIDYILFLESYDERKTNIIDIISGTMLFILCVLFLSWWLIPVRLIREGCVFKATKT